MVSCAAPGVGKEAGTAVGARGTTGAVNHAGGIEARITLFVVDKQGRKNRQMRHLPSTTVGPNTASAQVGHRGCCLSTYPMQPPCLPMAHLRSWALGAVQAASLRLLRIETVDLLLLASRW